MPRLKYVHYVSLTLLSHDEVQRSAINNESHVNSSLLILVLSRQALRFLNFFHAQLS